MLVVDDDEFNMIPLEMLFKKNNVHTVKAFNGKEAVRIIKADRQKKCCNNRIRVVVMDLSMPVLDGFEASEQIVSILHDEYPGGREAARKLPPESLAKEMRLAIIALTSYLDGATMERVRTCGMVEGVQKPINSFKIDEISSQYFD